MSSIASPGSQAEPSTEVREVEGPGDSGEPADLPRDATLSVLGTYREAFVELWDQKHLLYQLTRRDIRIRYKQAAMGFAWAIFMPAVVVLSGVIVRYAMARLSGSELAASEITGMAVKALGWSYFVGALGFSVNSLVGNMTLVSKIYFPREVLPLSATLAQTFDSTVGAVALGIALPLLGVSFSTTVLWVPVLILLLFLITAAAGLFLSCANLFFRDVKYIVRVVTTFGIFFTPVFFEPEMFGQTGGTLMMLNPLAPILEGLRLSVIEGHNLALPLVHTMDDGSLLAWSPWYMAYAVVWGVGGMLGSTYLFHRSEFKFAEYV